MKSCGASSPRPLCCANFGILVQWLLAGFRGGAEAPSERMRASRMPHLEARSRNSLRARPWHPGPQLPAPRPTVRLILRHPPRRIRARQRGLWLARLLHTGPLVHRFAPTVDLSLAEPTNLKKLKALLFQFQRSAHRQEARFLVCGRRHSDLFVKYRSKQLYSSRHAGTCRHAPPGL